MTGDYSGLHVLRFYLVYRAMVRAKISRLRAAQLEPGTMRSNAQADYRRYVDLAGSYMRTPSPAIILMHGLAGSGKTTCSQALLEIAGAVRIRSDVERKRLHGMGPLERTRAGIDRDLYASRATDTTYRRLWMLAQDVISAGFVVVVDATFRQRWQRDLFRSLAADEHLPLVILALHASEATLRARLAVRVASGRDASDADVTVLEQQLLVQEPLAADEQSDVVPFNAEDAIDGTRVSATWRAVRARLAGDGRTQGSRR